MKRVEYSYFKTYQRSLENPDMEVISSVQEILEAVRKEGDKAVSRFTKKFDGVSLSPDQFQVTPEEFEKAQIIVKRQYEEVFLSFLKSAKNIREYHIHQQLNSWEYQKEGALFGQKVTPIQKAGVYIPGGTAFYPSSLLMNVIPATIAAVPEITVMTPPNKNGEVHPLLLALCQQLGVQRVFKVGGAQSIAAMAYGTETISKVYKITGPGNIYVATAKQLVQGVVGIDSIAGPSEVAIIADSKSHPEWIAADLCAQAEHDPNTSVYLISLSEKLLDEVDFQLNQLLPSLERKEIIENALSNLALSVKVGNDLEAFDVVNRLSPEHVEVMLDIPPNEIMEKIDHAGAVFIGEFTSVPVGDYFAGPNHVIPTGGTAVFSSPLGVYDFLKRTSYLRVSRNYLQNHGKDVALQAEFENLQAHAVSIEKRLTRE